MYHMTPSNKFEVVSIHYLHTPLTTVSEVPTVKRICYFQTLDCTAKQLVSQSFVLRCEFVPFHMLSLQTPTKVCAVAR